MLNTLFITVLNLSITASWIAIAVILLRFALKKAPKWIMGILWSFVAFRLICPFSIESALSLIPSAQTIPQDIIYSNSPNIHSGINALNSAVNPIITDGLSPNVGASANPVQIIMLAASIIWIIGMAGMMIYSVLSYIRIRKSVRESVKFKDNILVCDSVSTPFILGVIKPKIYLPSNMNEEDLPHVIAHEKAHLKRRDHITKPFGFLLLTIYWFNPILWLAYILMCRDIELACDEKVIKEASTDIKKAYSAALINCSAPKKVISACPVAFGETGIKSKIKNVLSYKKPAFWVIIIAIAVCIITAVCMLTNPVTAVTETPFGKEYIVAEGENSWNLSSLYPDNQIKRYKISDDGKILVSEYDAIPQNSEAPWSGGFSANIKAITQCKINEAETKLPCSLKISKWQNAAVWKIEIDHPNEVYYLFQQKNGECYLTRWSIAEDNGKEFFLSIEKMHPTDNSSSIAIIGGADGPIAIKTSEE